jgi:hypothetical protein
MATVKTRRTFSISFRYLQRRLEAGVDGSQLGYLDWRLASDIHRDAGKPWSWSAIFKHANRHPSTDEVVGAVIVLTRSKLDAEGV